MKRLLMILITMLLLMSCRDMMDFISESDSENAYLDDLFGPDGMVSQLHTIDFQVIQGEIV